MKMNLPNKLTILRVFMIPFFVIFMLLSVSGMDIEEASVSVSSFTAYRITAVAIFCIASFTDFLDGYIARKQGLVTDFGKFMDPLADKLLVCSALILLTAEGSLPALVVIIIIAREFIISGFRLVASDGGIVLAASWWGKFKTTFQMIMCLLLIINLDYAAVNIIEQIFIYASLALSLISLIDYLIKNRKVIADM